MTTAAADRLTPALSNWYQADSLDETEAAKHTPQADAKAFNRWYVRTMGDADGRFTHMPPWLKADMRNAWIAGVNYARTAHSQAKRIEP